MAVIKIDGDASGALRSISQIENALGGIQKSVSAATRSLGSLQGALASIAGIAAGGSLMSFVDELQNMQNKLRIATGSQEEFNKSMEYVKAIADKTGQSLASTGDLYASVARNAKTLGYNQDQVVTVTNAMATALKASGASAQGSASVMYQFSQILAKGKVNGDEFTTIMENLGGPVMDLVAKNMGLTTEQLLKYKEKGLIGAKDFTDALIRSMGELDGMAGKSSQTIGQSIQRIQNAFGTAVLAIDNASGFSQTFADIAQKIADNGENLIPVIKVIGAVMAGLAIYFAPVVALFVAGAAAALYFADVIGPILKPVVDAVSAALSGLGRQLVGVGAGLMALVRGENPFEAYSKALDDFDNKAKTIPKAAKDTKLLDDALKGAKNTTTATAGQLSGIGLKYQEILKDLKAEAALQGATSKELDIQKQLLTVNKQLEYSLTEAQKKELTVLYEKIQATKDLISTNEMINKLQSDTTTARIQDLGVQQVTAQLESYRLSVGKQTYEANKGRVQQAIEENIQVKALNEYSQQLKNSQVEITALSIKDLDLREQSVAVEKERLKYGSLFTDEMEAAVRANVANNQALKEAVALEQQRALATGSAIPQTKADQINTATGAMSRLDPSLKAQQDYMTEKAALENSEVLAADQKNQMLQKLEYEHQQKMNGIRLSAFEQQLKMAGVTDATILNVAKTTMEQSQMVVQGGIVGIQGGLSMLSGFLEQAGKNNKKAFEAQKAVAIAQTIISTYQAATQAFAAMSMIPFIGPVLGFAAAATIVAAGMANVAAIKNQQYSGRQLGGPVMGNKPYMVGENGPELFTPNTTGSITRNQDLGGSSPTNINFTIVANDTQGFDQLLSSRKGVIQQIISDAMLEKGQRSIV